MLEYVAVLCYQGAYSENVEMEILERIFHQSLEETNRGPRVNMQIISINCVKKRQSALTKALYQSTTGADGSDAALRICGIRRKLSDTGD